MMKLAHSKVCAVLSIFIALAVVTWLNFNEIRLQRIIYDSSEERRLYQQYRDIYREAADTTLRNDKQTKNYRTQIDSPWKDVPKFDLYLRMSSWDRLVKEYKRWFVKSYRLFWPPERTNSLILVLDDNNKLDHPYGKVLSAIWPYPRICYRKPAKDPKIYQHGERKRMYWDGFYPEACTTAEYVGFVDTDTLWSSLVTPESLFENGKAVVLPRIGKHGWKCWADVTEFMLGYKEVSQCMSYFPVMIKVAHIIELRKFIEKKHQKPFDEVYQDALEFTLHVEKKWGRDCMCQYSIMCNYIWYHRRDEYKFYMQMVPQGKWDGKEEYTPSMATLDYLQKKIPPESKMPKPRIAIHGRHLWSFRDGERRGYSMMDTHNPPGNLILDEILKEGLCYNGGFQYCPEACTKFNSSKIYYRLYAFEFDEWDWDKRCMTQQKKYFDEVQGLLNYYRKSRKPVFGLDSILDMCSLF